MKFLEAHCLENMAVTKKPVQELNAEMDATNEEEDQVRTVSFEEFEMLRRQVAALTKQLQRDKIPQPNQHALQNSRTFSAI